MREEVKNEGEPVVVLYRFDERVLGAEQPECVAVRPLRHCDKRRGELEASVMLSVSKEAAFLARARGRRVCGMSVGPRAMRVSALRLFHNIEG